MSHKPLKRYIFASDFDQTLTFNDSGYVLSELVGIPTAEFERKAQGMAKLNLVQQGAELAYLLLHDPEFRARVRKEHLREVGKIIRLKENIPLLYQVLEKGIDGHGFDFYVLSASPVEVIQSALEGIVPADHIYGTEFEYGDSGEIERIIRATAGYGKVAVLDRLQIERDIAPDHVVYVGDGSSDVHVMLHVNARDGLTIAVSESPHKSWAGSACAFVSSLSPTACQSRNGNGFGPIASHCVQRLRRRHRERQTLSKMLPLARAG
jgi:HAD superfamily phosphoserine phosphatase-like hydrolase